MNIVIVDHEPPTIVCPIVPISSATSGCETVVDYELPITHDNCGIQSLELVAGLPSGSNFTVQNTTVTYVVTDMSNNTASCSFFVAVLDGNLPTIQCPDNVAVNTTLSTCNANVVFPTPVGSQNCSASSTSQTLGLASGALFPAGTTVDTFTVTDIVGRKASCSFNVEVIDSFAPSISCPIPVSVPTSAGQCTAVVNYGQVSYVDNCQLYVNLSRTGLANGSSFPLGQSTVEYTARDELGLMLSSSCSFIVTVWDNQSPTIVCPTNITASTSPGTCVAVVDYVVSAFDNCAVSNLS